MKITAARRMDILDAIEEAENAQETYLGAGDILLALSKDALDVLVDLATDLLNSPTEGS